MLLNKLIDERGDLAPWTAREEVCQVLVLPSDLNDLVVLCSEWC